jgi:hypothetical protein
MSISHKVLCGHKRHLGDLGLDLLLPHDQFDLGARLCVLGLHVAHGHVCSREAGSGAAARHLANLNSCVGVGNVRVCPCRGSGHGDDADAFLGGLLLQLAENDLGAGEILFRAAPFT